MLCLAAQMKKSNSYELDFFGWGTGIQTPEVTESESVALPLGDAPIFNAVYYTILLTLCQEFNQKKLKEFLIFFCAFSWY